jgi:hypothetical protein
VAFIFTNAPTQIAGVTYGRYFMIQIVAESETEKNILSGTNLFGLYETSYGLDSYYPYQENGYDFWHPGGYSYLTSDRWCDSPASSLASTTWLSRTDSFTAYLMFQPIPFTNSIPIPMYGGTWGWSAVTKTNGVPYSYSVLSSTLPSPSVNSTLNFPQWTTNSLNFQYQTNSAPYNEN